MMSAKFNAALNDAEWAAFKAGQALANRTQWMQRAGMDERNRGLVEVCASAARGCNREYLKAVAEWRALQKKPQRKRA
jgi:alkylhydroperoxidase/carboxymuconolactone decarboxylase family protein YurZ